MVPWWGLHWSIYMKSSHLHQWQLCCCQCWHRFTVLHASLERWFPEVLSWQSIWHKPCWMSQQPQEKQILDSLSYLIISGTLSLMHSGWLVTFQSSIKSTWKIGVGMLKKKPGLPLQVGASWQQWTCQGWACTLTLAWWPALLQGQEWQIWRACHTITVVVKWWWWWWCGSKPRQRQLCGSKSGTSTIMASESWQNAS